MSRAIDTCTCSHGRDEHAAGPCNYVFTYDGHPTNQCTCPRFIPHPQPNEVKFVREKIDYMLEAARLRMLWQSLDASLKSVRRHLASKGGQQAGIPDMLSVAQIPSVMKRLEQLCAAALGEDAT